MNGSIGSQRDGHGLHACWARRAINGVVDTSKLHLHALHEEAQLLVKRRHRQQARRVVERLEAHLELPRLCCAARRTLATNKDAQQCNVRCRLKHDSGRGGRQQHAMLGRRDRPDEHRGDDCRVSVGIAYGRADAHVRVAFGLAREHLVRMRFRVHDHVVRAGQQHARPRLPVRRFGWQASQLLRTRAPRDHAPLGVDSGEDRAAVDHSRLSPHDRRLRAIEHDSSCGEHWHARQVISGNQRACERSSTANGWPESKRGPR